MTGGRLKRVRRLPRRRGRFCFTYGDGVADVDIARADRLPPRARQARDGHRGAARRAASARWSIDGDRGDRLRREAARATAAGSTAASSCCRPRCSTTSTATTRSGSASRWSGWPRDGQLMAYRARGLLAADGHAARQASSRGALGSRARRRGRRGELMPASSGAARRVLVTGHTGFKGGWLALWLRSAGRARSPASRLPPPTEPSLFDAARRRRDGIDVAHRRHPRSRRRARRDGAAPAGDRVPPGGAAAGAALLSPIRSRPSRPT